MRYLISASQVSTEHWYATFPDAFSFSHLEVVQPHDQVWIVIDEGWQKLVSSVVERGAHAIIMTLTDNSREAAIAFALGARAYVHVLASPAHFIQVSEVVERGGVWIGSDLMKTFIAAAALDESSSSVASEPSISISVLTERERQVAECVAQGANNKEIARTLDITERTVKAHLGAIFEKLSVRDRLHLALIMKEHAHRKVTVSF